MTDGADGDRFRELVETYQKRVLRLTASILGPGHDAAAEDAAQEVFLRVHRALPSFRGDSAVGSWIYRIAWNVAIDMRGRLARHPKPVDLQAAAQIESGDDPARAASDAWTKRAVLSAMEEIPDLYRTVLHLHYWMGEDVAEIAALLGAPAGTVKSYLHRGRDRLKKVIEAKGVRL